MLLLAHCVLLCANRVQEIWVLAETVAILYHIVEDASLAIKLLVPLVCAVVRLSSLQATENILVRVGDSGNLLNSDRTIKRVVSIQAIWIRFLLLLYHFRRYHIFRWLQVNLQHLAKKDPVLVLNLTHAFCNNKV